MLLLYIWANFRCFGSYGCNDTVHICAKLRKYQAMLQHSAKGLVPQIWCSERCRLRIREKTSRLQEVYTTWKRWKVAWDSEPPILISITRIVGDLTYHEPSSFASSQTPHDIGDLEEVAFQVVHDEWRPKTSLASSMPIAPSPPNLQHSPPLY